MPLQTPVSKGLAEPLGKNLAEYVFRNVPVFHAGLVLDRYLPIWFEAGPHPFVSEEKGPFLREFVRSANKAYRDSSAPWRAWSRRHREMVEGWTGAVSVVMRPRWRWVVGLGNQTILETGITLHHTYGVPYIPGSGLKGLTQALVELEPPEGLDAGLKVAIFGEQPGAGKEARHAAGEVVFLGMMPEDGPEPPRLAVDVMTPHFPRYYQGERAHPLEVEDPTPVPFLVVAGGEYRVTVAPRRRATPGDVVARAAQLCRQALEDMGIGGKTAKGYGYFVSTSPRKES